LKNKNNEYFINFYIYFNYIKLYVKIKNIFPVNINFIIEIIYQNTKKNYKQMYVKKHPLEAQGKDLNHS
jgi:hypothetical protein